MTVAAPAAADAAASANTVFEPRLVAFVCKWCTYAGADLAGTSRMLYPPNVRVIKLPCTGRIDIAFIIRAFSQGADGVIVSGCHPGDCHYSAGNFRARRRWTLFRDLLDILGFDLRRFQCAWISAAEGTKWAATIRDFTEEMRALGPYTAMRQLAGERGAPVAPRAAVWHGRPARREPEPSADPATRARSEALAGAIAAALTDKSIAAAVGWTLSPTLRRPRPLWITAPEEADRLGLPGDSDGNLARLLKHPQLTVRPLGMVVRHAEMQALNVLRQESQVAEQDVVLFAVARDGRFLGRLDWDAAVAALAADAEGRVNGFSPEVEAEVSRVLALPSAERWDYWRTQFARCIKCYACRNSCPMCGCEVCLADKNQPQWFPTAADGPGNFAWHVIRAFHLAGRCVGCGACQAACPAGVAVNLLGAALARSAAGHFGHHAGASHQDLPLQAAFRTDDRESFIK
ncbi:MAG: hydrogenase iron-sulfur subunit [Planctomycetes bacterium]|nr:hydrogenase iron-sulfur subunit [Planctomycetota bacterium]